ncbi:MAG TPA: 5'/3'-nucleotidase SurE [Candidatus Babeliales bacterium]|nr:5'/3'-nucleotidase SurE [Candidatus Babeliales bacterium]
MRILLTNDDGIDSPGIRALVDTLVAEHAIVVVAPAGNRSGVSHAITADEAITIERRHDLSVPSYACSGTPADCVFLGSTELFGRPELVVSGINHGPNLADDVNYSGTVAGAVEGSLLGIPSLAVSLASDHEEPHAPRHWESAAEIVYRCIARAYQRLADATCYWNLNVPNRPLEQIRGIAVTRLGRKRICGRMIGQEQDGTTQYFRAWESPFETDRETLGTDIGAVHAGYASLTPLVLDRTSDSGLRALSPLIAEAG